MDYPHRFGPQSNFKLVFETQCEAAVQLVDIGRKMAINRYGCERGLVSFLSLSLFQENFPAVLEHTGMEQL